MKVKGEKMREATTNINKLTMRNGEGFTWGKILKIHAIGEYTIAEFHPWTSDDCTVLIDVPNYNVIHYYGWINGKASSHAWFSMDEALAGLIGYKYEGPNGKASRYFMKMIKED